MTTEYIEMAPNTWATALPILAMVMGEGNSTGRREARAELAKMAQAADRWNANAAAMRDLIQAAEAVLGDGDLPRSNKNMQALFSAFRKCEKI